jgi:tetratricopeptide (TPR) repeat protein
VTVASREHILAGCTLALTGCAGELAAFAALAFSMSVAAWILGRGRQRQALYEAEMMRHAIAAGEHRDFEQHLRKELALAEAGEGVSLERQWRSRSQLAGLLVAEWRLDEALAVYEADGSDALALPYRLLASFGRHELVVLTETPDEERLHSIRTDRDVSLKLVPGRWRSDVEQAWNALEGLCLVRMGRAREGAALLERGLRALEYNPALVVYLFHLGQAYEHIGERKLAGEYYEKATRAFPGTRLASEAKSRLMALGPGGTEGLFRGMLPEAPAASPGTALATFGDPPSPAAGDRGKGGGHA